MLRGLISAAGLAVVRGQVTNAVKRTGRRAGLFALIIATWLIAFGFGLAALTVWLAGELGIILALTLIAGVFALIGLIMYVAMQMADRKQKPAASPFPPQFAGLGAGSAKSATGESPTGALLGSIATIAVLGWLLGRKTGRK
jgi:uncharacterized membrane protein YebE (DUF533 family)